MVDLSKEDVARFLVLFERFAVACEALASSPVLAGEFKAKVELSGEVVLAGCADADAIPVEVQGMVR